tara:strand:- start:776 stop:1075 length:300 start_codon:yes stop_codon:yes gene_type:complete
MKKIIFLMLLLTSCSYKPVIDTAGRSGTFDKSNSDQITNDLQHCKTLAKENTNSTVEGAKYFWNYYARAYTLWISPKAEYNYPKIYRNCLTNRGHSVLN